MKRYECQKSMEAAFDFDIQIRYRCLKDNITPPMYLPPNGTYENVIKIQDLFVSLNRIFWNFH